MRHTRRGRQSDEKAVRRLFSLRSQALCALEPPVATAARLLCELGGPCTGDDRRGKLGGLIVFLKGVIRTFLSLDESSVA
ncbi:uncharacterized protein LOC134530858 isoform X4 [Bacillus rossius redtenbacheri]|uniref:uncharacterized protein LOC134530858 isoform X4 n=1 Tax=Bacillus rossius redtenbacheri TaxID=93214 RepID=UPI002FDCB171